MNADLPLTGKAEALLPGGEALVRSAGTVFLVGNCLPGDEISFSPVQKRRGTSRGRLIKIIKSSRDRVETPCPVAEACGGCAMQALKPALHAGIKSAWVLDAFRKSRIEQTVWIPAVEAGLYGRRRLRWYVGEEGNAVFLGFLGKNSHTVVRHHLCMTATPELNMLRVILEESAAEVCLRACKSVQALQVHDGIHVILESAAYPEKFVAPCHESGNIPLQWWHRDEKKTTPLTRPARCFHDLLPAAGEDNLSVQIGPDDFVQGQAEGNRQMIGQVIEWSRGARFVVDLFSGVGNLSLPVTGALKARVLGAELNVASVRAANANAKRLGLDARYVQANLFEKFDVEPFAGADVLILDPPRRGAKMVCGMMGRLLPAKIIMVNCDVASGGRDGELLQSLGYRLHTLRALDIFPYTGHIEAMSLWTR
ncbi:MAG: 23S rRNA methyltransferase [Mariprofundaceae bacterium]|nr:23S rRNA methyltransferase [Mariprofundaceae bacterium]